MIKLEIMIITVYLMWLLIYIYIYILYNLEILFYKNLRVYVVINIICGVWVRHKTTTFLITLWVTMRMHACMSG